MSVHNISGIKFRCPVFTEFVHNVDDGVYSCQYELWFYGIAATLICFGGLLPITLLICCWAKWKNTKTERRKLHRQDSDASTHTDLSRPHDHGVYEVMRDDDGRDVFFRTAKGPYHKRYGTFSVPDFRSLGDRGTPHLYPEITQIEASESHQSTPVSPMIGPPKANEHFQKQAADTRTLPSCIKRTKTDKYTTERIDSYLKGVEESKKEKTVVINNGVQTKNQGSTESLSKKEMKKSGEFSSSPEMGGLVMRIEPSLPKEIPAAKENVGDVDSCQQSASKLITPSSATFPSFQPTPPMKHLVDRLDFDQYLCDCVSKLPEDQKNGTFLIRDSQSNEGCKVLTIYFKNQEPGKTLYHYKISFNDEMKVCIPGTKEVFVDLEELVHFYRKQRTVLPCLLSNCLGKSF